MLREQGNATDDRQQKDGDNVNRQKPVADLFSLVKEGEELLGHGIIADLRSLLHGFSPLRLVGSVFDKQALRRATESRGLTSRHTQE